MRMRWGVPDDKLSTMMLHRQRSFCESDAKRLRRHMSRRTSPDMVPDLRVPLRGRLERIAEIDAELERRGAREA